MIYSITFKNFFSFKDEGKMSLTVPGKSPDTEKYCVDKTGAKLAKVHGVFGHNASGKTNAIKAVSFMKFLIMAAYTEDPEKKLPIMPFVFAKNKKRLTELNVVFSIYTDVYEYFVAIEDGAITKEVLKKKAFGKKRFSTLFDREFIDGVFMVKDKFSLGFKKDDTRAQRQNASILATALRDGHKETKRIVDFWRTIHTNTYYEGKIESEKYNLLLAANLFLKNELLKKRAEKFVAKFDLGLSGFKIEKKSDENGEGYITLHGVHQDKYPLSFRFESSGTKKLFGILAKILPVLENGGVAVLDEFDSDLHPIMAEEIVNLFFSPQTNPHNAQLIFSAHHAPLLNLLDKYHITLVEKNKNGESEIWRLDDMTGVRADDNYYAKYIGGAYGATPNIAL